MAMMDLFLFFLVLIQLVRVYSNWALQCQYEQRKEYSQQGQDGILDCIFGNIGTIADEQSRSIIEHKGYNGTYVEFGFNSPSFEGGSGSNSYWLYKSKGWKGLLLDGDYQNKSINLHGVWITESNICDIFQSNGLDYYDIDYLSIDIDSIDLWIMRAILTCGFRPRVISVEYNSNLPMYSTITVTKDSPAFDGSRLCGASFGALKMVANQFGYTPIAVVKYLDIFFVRNDLLQGLKTLEFTESMVEGETLDTCKSLPKVQRYVMDYAVYYHSNGNVTKAKRAAANSNAISRLYKRHFQIEVYDMNDGKIIDEIFVPEYEYLETNIRGLDENGELLPPLYRTEEEIFQDIIGQIIIYCKSHNITNVTCSKLRDAVFAKSKCAIGDIVCNDSVI